MSGRAVRRTKKALGMRRAAFDALKGDTRGRTRPGSLNPKKSGGKV